MNGSQEKKTVAFEYADESDSGPYPIPDNPLIEGGSDHHILIIDQDARILYESFAGLKNRLTDPGPPVPGLSLMYPIMPCDPQAGLQRMQPVLPFFPALSGMTKSVPGRLTMHFGSPFPPPGVHMCGLPVIMPHQLRIRHPPMGQRFRLKSSFNSSGYPYQAKIVLEALKKYGMILSDNGAPWYVTGVPDEQWDNDALHTLHQLKGSDFEAVNCSSLIIDQIPGRPEHLRSAPVSLMKLASTGMAYGILTTTVPVPGIPGIKHTPSEPPGGLR